MLRNFIIITRSDFIMKKFYILFLVLFLKHNLFCSASNISNKKYDFFILRFECDFGDAFEFRYSIISKSKISFLRTSKIKEFDRYVKVDSFTITDFPSNIILNEDIIFDKKNNVFDF